MTPGLVVAVLVAGAIGAVLRYLAGLAAATVRSARRRDLPWAVLLVNVVGSFVTGLVIGLAETGLIDGDVSLVMVVGFAGGLTTFSTLSVETIQLVVSGRWRTAAASIVANVVLGLAAIAAGWVIGASWPIPTV